MLLIAIDQIVPGGKFGFLLRTSPGTLTQSWQPPGPYSLFVIGLFPVPFPMRKTLLVLINIIRTHIRKYLWGEKGSPHIKQQEGLKQNKTKTGRGKSHVLSVDITINKYCNI